MGFCALTQDRGNVATHAEVRQALMDAIGDAVPTAKSIADIRDLAEAFGAVANTNLTTPSSGRQRPRGL